MTVSIKQPSHERYRPDIDGLRAIAVLSVVLYHGGIPAFTGGFVGVDIFFVISGYLITGIILRELEAGDFTFAGFYARRVKRIFPALFATLALSAIAAFFLLIPSDLKSFGESFNATVLFFSNFHFLKQVGYFDGPAIDKPLLHTWSLAVEEQFYMAWPIILMLIYRLVPRRTVAVIAGLALLSFILAEFRMYGHQKDAFYISWLRGWELMIGAGLAAAALKAPQRAAAPLVGAGLAAIAFAVFAYNSSTPFPGFHAVLPCAGAAFIIAGGSIPNRFTAMLGFGPIRFIGLISYSLYLVHWPLFSFAHLYLDRPLTLAESLAIVAASILLSALSWRYIETPFRRVRLPDKAVILRAVPVGAALYAIGLSFFLTEGLPARVNQGVLQADAATNEREWSITAYCHDADVIKAHSGHSCALGAATRDDYDFFVWGDSHAHHYVPALDALAKNSGQSGLMFSMLGCPPFLGGATVTKRCHDYNDSIYAWAKQQKRLRFVVLAGYWLQHTKDFEEAAADGDAYEKPPLAAAVKALQDLNLSVVILDQVPDFAQSAPLCAARALMYGRDAEACVKLSKAEFTARYRPVASYMSALKAHYGLTVASPLEGLCDRDACYATWNGEYLFRDNNHLRPVGALHLMPYLDIPGFKTPAKKEALAASIPAFGAAIENSSIGGSAPSQAAP